jgi:hypothetical protein
MDQSRAIATHVMRRLDNLLSEVRREHRSLDPSVVLGEVAMAVRRWQAVHDTFRSGQSDIVDQDTHVLQSLMTEVALELGARGLSVTYAVGVPDAEEPEAWATGTQPGLPAAKP